MIEAHSVFFIHLIVQFVSKFIGSIINYMTLQTVGVGMIIIIHYEALKVIDNLKTYTGW